MLFVKMGAFIYPRVCAHQFRHQCQGSARRLHQRVLVFRRPAHHYRNRCRRKARSPLHHRVLVFRRVAHQLGNRGRRCEARRPLHHRVLVFGRPAHQFGNRCRGHRVLSSCSPHHPARRCLLACRGCRNFRIRRRRRGRGADRAGVPAFR